MKRIRNRKKEVLSSDKYLQVGNLIKIKKEPPAAKRTGFFLNTFHQIVDPPENYVNSQASIWVKSKNGNKKQLQFMYWVTTPF